MHFLRLKHKLSLRWYFIFIISFIWAVSTLILLLIPAGFYKHQYYEQTQNYCKNMVTQTSAGISESLQQFDDTMDRMITDENFISLMDADLEESARVYQYQRVIWEYFPHTRILGHYIQGIDFYIKNPSIHLQYGSDSVMLEEPFTSSYYSSALCSPLSLNWNDIAAEDALIVSRIIYDLETYDVRGLLVISVSRDFLKDKFNTYNTMEVDNFYIVDENGIILCSGDDASNGDTYPQYDQIFTKTTGTKNLPEQIIVYCKSSMITYQKPYQNWSTVVNIRKDLLFQDFNTILRRFYLIAFLIILLGIGLSIKFSRYITRPVQELVANMEQVQEGNLQVKMEQDTPIREISLASQGFNTMVQRLDTLINTIYRIELAQKEAQFHALQAQINPHFLFNTMQLINGKAYEYEAYPVCDMVQSLCYMLETTLSYREERTFSLREELEYLHHYSQILHYKYLDKISLQFHIPETLMDCQIPILTFQPFIENAVVHGLEPMQTNGYVSLSVVRRDKDLIVTIKDNGIGIRPDILAKLQENIPLSNQVQNNSYHMALHNVQTRIRLLYGESYGYQIESHLYGGTVVTLTIPYRTEKEWNHD